MAAIKSVLKWNIRDSFSFCAGIRWKSTLVHQLHICEPGGCVYVETSVGDGAGGVEDVKPFIGGGGDQNGRDGKRANQPGSSS